MVVATSAFLVFRVAPTHGNKTPLVYISICSLVGSLSIMAIKGFGVAIKLTLSGHNQLGHPSTYIFGVTVATCIFIQMNYFNKALDLFSTNIVNPIYYVSLRLDQIDRVRERDWPADSTSHTTHTQVFFTSATTIASLILFQGYGASGGVNMVSLLTGYIVIFLGVYLLNGRDALSGKYERADDGNGQRGRHSLLETRQSMSIGAGLSMESGDGHLPLSATPGSTYVDRRSFSGSRDDSSFYRSPGLGGSSQAGGRRKGPPLASSNQLKEVLYDADGGRRAETPEASQFMLHSGSDIEEEDEPQSDAGSTTSRTPVSPTTRQMNRYGS